MRILVLSDSHSDVYSLKTAIENHREADVVIFLGDGERDFYEISSEIGNKHLIMVKGNCDLASLQEANRTENIAGKKIFITHGYLENVKFGDDTLIYKGQSFGADIILYGHTHIPVSKYIDGVYVFNPGSIRNGDYGFIDITEKGIICINAKL